MKTVSFSSPAVRKMLQNDFVCQLINTTGDPTFGASVGHAPGDAAGLCTRGIGKQNVQCLFLTPSGEIFHAASGYRGPQDLRSEREFALALYRGVRKQLAGLGTTGMGATVFCGTLAVRTRAPTSLCYMAG